MTKMIELYTLYNTAKNHAYNFYFFNCTYNKKFPRFVHDKSAILEGFNHDY